MHFLQVHQEEETVAVAVPAAEIRLQQIHRIEAVADLDEIRIVLVDAADRRTSVRARHHFRAVPADALKRPRRKRHAVETLALVNVRDIKGPVIPVDRGPGHFGGIAVPQRIHAPVRLLNGAEHEFGIRHPRKLRVLPERRKADGHQALSFVQDDRDAAARFLERPLLKVDEVALLFHLDAVVRTAFFLPCSSEQERLTVKKDEVRVVSVVHHQPELSAGKFKTERRAEDRHAFMPVITY